MKELGTPCLRYGLPNHLIHLGPGRYDWSFTNEFAVRLVKRHVMSPESLGLQRSTAESRPVAPLPDRGPKDVTQDLREQLTNLGVGGGDGSEWAPAGAHFQVLCLFDQAEPWCEGLQFFVELGRAAVRLPLSKSADKACEEALRDLHHKGLSLCRGKPLLEHLD